MRVGCGSATVGIFAEQFKGLVDDEVGGGRRPSPACSPSTRPGTARHAPSGLQVPWPQEHARALLPGGHPAPAGAAPTSTIRWPSSRAGTPRRLAGAHRLLMVSTTGGHAAWYVLDETLCPPGIHAAGAGSIVERIGELRGLVVPRAVPGRCRPAACAPASPENPVRLARGPIKRALVSVTCGGVRRFMWPGGGITVMVDVIHACPTRAGTVPAGHRRADQFTMKLDDYRARRGHMGLCTHARRCWATAPGTTVTARPPRGASRRRRCRANPRPLGSGPLLGFGNLASTKASRLAGGRWHFSHGPIDLVIGARGKPCGWCRLRHEAAWQRSSHCCRNCR